MILRTLKEMDNKQLYDFTREQTQVFLTARLGDGCIHHTKSNSWIYTTNCKHIEYLEFKKSLIGKGNISILPRNGYSKTPIYQMYGGAFPSLELIKNLPLKEVLNNLDYLGLILWFYDDGSLHKTKLFYNLNTQGFSEEVNKELFVPFFLKFGIKAKPTIERKKDGREFWYLRVGKYDGAYEISELLNKYKVNCFDYKVWSSETIQNWSKLQEWLKSGNNSNCSTKKKSMILKKIEQGEL